MEENNKKWENVEHQLASELISGSVRQAKAKDFAIWCLTVAIVIIGIGSITRMTATGENCSVRMTMFHRMEMVRIIITQM